VDRVVLEPSLMRVNGWTGRSLTVFVDIWLFPPVSTPAPTELKLPPRTLGPLPSNFPSFPRALAPLPDSCRPHHPISAKPHPSTNTPHARILPPPPRRPARRARHSERRGGARRATCISLGVEKNEFFFSGNLLQRRGHAHGIFHAYPACPQRAPARRPRAAPCGDLDRLRSAWARGRPGDFALFALRSSSSALFALKARSSSSAILRSRSYSRSCRLHLSAQSLLPCFTAFVKYTPFRAASSLMHLIRNVSRSSPSRGRVISSMVSSSSDPCGPSIRSSC